MASSNYRAKVYILNSDGNWIDFGTGHVDLVQDNYKETYVNYLRVISDGTWKGELNETAKEIKKKLKSDKEEESYILYRPILKEMKFQKQGGSILVWSDEEIGKISVSFLEASHCEDVWYCDLVDSNVYFEGKNYKIVMIKLREKIDTGTLDEKRKR